MFRFAHEIYLLLAFSSCSIARDAPIGTAAFTSSRPINDLPDFIGSALPPRVSTFLLGNPIAKGGLGSLQGNPTDTEFDYIVVGGGNTGAALGSRLAEAGNKVAIIEAGSFFETSKPLLATTPTGDIIGVGADIKDSIGSTDWKFQTVPQAGANGRRVHFARGKCLGGSSALNFMIYHRATVGSCDAWAEAVGDDTYRFSNFNRFYKKAVTVTPPNRKERKQNASTPFDASDFYSNSRGGPVQVSYTNWVSSWSTWMEQGMKAVGIRRTNDFDKGSLLGYHYTQTTIRQRDGTRSSSAEYVYDARKNQSRNLKVFLDTHALRVHFNKNKKATGVTVRNNGMNRRLSSRKEVILSAGAFQSPQLLMVSGVGPKETLRKFKIPIVSALPGVGQNMWDHIFFGPSYAVDFPTLNDILNHPLALLKAIIDYILRATGPLTSNIIEIIGWEKLPAEYRENFSRETRARLAEFPADWPEVEYLGANGYLGDFASPITSQPKDGRNYATILGALVAPVSRGNVTIQSASAMDAPLINPNWFTAKTDQEVGVAWFRRMRDVWKTQKLRSIAHGKEYWPGEKVQSDKQILNIIRKSLMTVWHPACTCKMGKRSDKMAVADAQGRVFGVKGLRVVDASAFPLLPPGHPMATLYALAEKIAEDIIKEK